jgi:hypothetical protein
MTPHSSSSPLALDVDANPSPAPESPAAKQDGTSADAAGAELACISAKMANHALPREQGHRTMIAAAQVPT